MADPIFRVINSSHFYSNKSGGDWIQRRRPLDPLKRLQDLVRPDPFSYTAVADRVLDRTVVDNNLELQEVYAFRC
jgi:hypothetical protein